MISKLSDNDLINRYQRGDSRAFEVIVKRHEEHIYNFIFSKILDSSISKDVLQETYIKVLINLNKPDSYIEVGKFKYWVLRIANNLVMDYFRKKDYHVRECFYFERVMSVDPIDNPFEEDYEIQYEERLKKIGFAIESLPTHYQQIIQLRFENEMTFKEISEYKGTTLNSALGLCRNAVEALKKKSRC